MSSSPEVENASGQHSDSAVAQRYAAAAQEREPALCCPVNYDAKLLEKLPQEIIDKDYGCGDPSAYVKPGDTVLDLGSGGGKLCYMASQIVGAQGRVIGVDCNQEMLGLARKYQGEMADRLGYANVEFHYGRIQDLQLSLDRFDTALNDVAADSSERPLEVLDLIRSLRQEQPMIADDSVDCVISNCVLNLVNPDDRKQLFREIYRVLKRGGRAAISDIVSDEDVPVEMQEDGHLWSGCISGAWREDRFVDEFVAAGFYGAAIDKYQSEPWQVINGIEFRSATILAYKGKEGPCWERNQAVVYQGPFEQVKDDDGHIYKRGQRMAVCDKTFQILMRPPYEGLFIPIAPIDEILLEKATAFDCKSTRLRSPRETKGLEYDATRVSNAGVCDPDSSCC
jgi:ubiquinone/menaquinone biosynthesis C-methylase UbiE